MRKGVIIIIFFIIGLAFISYGLWESGIFNSLPITVVIGIIILTAMGIMITYNFIEQGDKKQALLFDDIEYDLTSFAQLPEKIKKFISQNENSLNVKVINEFIEKEIAGNNSQKNEKDLLLHSLLTESYKLQSRIENYIYKISRTGTINLLIGVITTFIAVTTLLIIIINVKDLNHESLDSFFVYLVPRLSLAIFIEIFSFFFLNLYRKNIDDARYFHNEKTNIDSKIISLKATLMIKNDDFLQQIITNFSNVERNPISKTIKKSKKEELDFSIILEQLKNTLQKS